MRQGGKEARRQGGKGARRQGGKEAWRGGNLLVELLLGLLPLLLLLPELL